MFSSYKAEFFGATRYFHPRMSLRLGVFKLLEMDGSQQGRGQECPCPRRLLQPAGAGRDGGGGELKWKIIIVRETVLASLKEKGGKRKRASRAPRVGRAPRSVP